MRRIILLIILLLLVTFLIGAEVGLAADLHKTVIDNGCLMFF